MHASVWFKVYKIVFKQNYTYSIKSDCHHTPLWFCAYIIHTYIMFHKYILSVQIEFSQIHVILLIKYILYNPKGTSYKWNKPLECLLHINAWINCDFGGFFHWIISFCKFCFKNDTTLFLFLAEVYFAVGNIIN